MTFACLECEFERGRPGRCPTHGAPLVEASLKHQPGLDANLGMELAGKYALIGILGRGAFGYVYRGWQEVLDRQVAVKLIRRSKAGGVAFRERFFLEARAVARLRGPNIVTVHDFGEEADGRLYMVLELVEGPNLRQAVPNGARIEPARAARLALPVLRALSEAHGQGIVHRDIKPSNLMLTVDDEGSETIKVLDFGVAKVTPATDALDPDAGSDPGAGRMTLSGQVVGTPRYVSPEQAAGLPVGPAADLYSLGVILFELMAGRPPFQGGDTGSTVAIRIHQPAPPLPEDALASPELRAVVAKALERLPEDRHASAAAFAEALRATPELRSVDSAVSAAFAAAPTTIVQIRADEAGSGAESSLPSPFAVDATSVSGPGLPPPPRRAGWVLAGLAALTGVVAVAVVSRSPAPVSVGGGPAPTTPPALASAPLSSAAALPGSAPPTAAVEAPAGLAGGTSSAPKASAPPTAGVGGAAAPASRRPPRAPGTKAPDIPYL